MSILITTDIFIERAKEIHSNKYDYTKVEYNGIFNKLIIICPKHGEFEQTPNNHLVGKGCPKCAGKNTTTEDFINKAKEKHGNKFDYSKVEYKTNKDKIIITCPIHGEFLMEPRNHLRVQSGCRKCKTNIRLTNEIFVIKAKLIHGDKYDYSKVDYQNKFSEILIICKLHGEFKQEARFHLEGRGCQKCSWKAIGDRTRYTSEEFINKAKNDHNKIKIICPLHGKFEQMPYTHLRGYGCHKCKESKGEKIIREFLIQNNIN